MRRLRRRSRLSKVAHMLSGYALATRQTSFQVEVIEDVAAEKRTAKPVPYGGGGGA